MSDIKRFGVMLDMSRNAVMRVGEIEKFILLVKKAGYDSVGLYLEDVYEIEGEQYFGYLRGKYTSAEIKEIDRFALDNGVELIPYIETLAHLNGLTRHRAYSDIFDIDDVLLIDEPKTYALIEKMFKTVSENFSSRVINIGFDEAYGAGRGKYLDKHGFCDRYELLIRHLNKVCGIAFKYGFKPHIWSDMFFRLACGEYAPADIPEPVKKAVPEGVGLAYWDYYHKDKEFYDKMFASHKSFGREIWFTGGAWSWFGFSPLAKQSLATMRPAMESVINSGVESVMIAMWGDGGKECSFFSLLHVLYAIRQYGYGNFDARKIKEGFKETFGLDFDGFMTLDLPNDMCEDSVAGDPVNPARVILYDDILSGVFEKNIAANSEIPYALFLEKAEKAKNDAGEFGYVFETVCRLLRLLAAKQRLGVDLRKAYKSGDRVKLKSLTDGIDGLIELVKDFHAAFRYQWFKENKPQGFEIQDARLGGLIMRLSTCKKRLSDYLDGSIDVIEELEEEILPQLDGKTLRSYSWSSIISENRI